MEKESTVGLDKLKHYLTHDNKANKKWCDDIVRHVQSLVHREN